MQAPRLWGLSVLKDQNLGGILMNVEQTVVFLAALAYFVVRHLDEEQASQSEREAALPSWPASSGRGGGAGAS